MSTYAELIFPVAVRQTFTYEIPEELRNAVAVGMRAWVPFRNQKSIGMVVQLHDKTPSYNTKNMLRLLDDAPLLPAELLELTHWVHKFYYCGWGEVIQAALPAGLNFQAQEVVHAAGKEAELQLSDREMAIWQSVQQAEGYSLKEANKRWSSPPEQEALRTLINRKLLQIWQEPVQKLTPKKEKQWHWSPDWNTERVHNFINDERDQGKNYKWLQALELLAELELPQFQADLTEYELLDYYSLNRIAEEGVIIAKEAERKAFSFDLPHEPASINTLNAEQQEAFNAIAAPMDAGHYQSFLLYGVTGSGKTEVYIHALKKARDAGRGGLILVPEISLTPQTVQRFYQIFGDDIAVLHSRLSPRERYRAWHALQRGDKRIAIGARSAVFAPVQDLGLLVVDEEHDSSYKQVDPAPRYHAREVAIMRAYKNKAVAIMGSATPAVTSLYAAKKEKMTLLTLNKRHEGATMPSVEVLDLTQYRAAMQGPLAVPLYNAINEALQAGEQTILLQNRRGFSSYLQCEACGAMPECPHCSVSLTYHKAKNHLRCHYCGYSSRVPDSCASCGAAELEKKGTGTQQVEEQLQQLFPEAEICRMDRDTTASRRGHETILNRFGRGDIDILLGTQLVAKGLDFPNVTVVGVINADTELAFPSFRAGERMYQLLSQVAGRSGRADKAGRVFLQTWQDEHYAIECAREHNHRAFARIEMQQRKLLDYPPYTRLINVQFKAKDAQQVAQIADLFTRCLRAVAPDKAVLGPAPSTITKLQGWVRWEAMIKFDTAATSARIEQLLDRTFATYEAEKPPGASSVRININVDALE